MGWLQERMITLVLPLLLAPLVTIAVQFSKKYNAWLDDQHALVKQGLAAAYATGFTALAAAVGQGICTDGSIACEITGLDWRVILTWAGSMAIHAWKRNR